MIFTRFGDVDIKAEPFASQAVQLVGAEYCA